MTTSLSMGALASSPIPSLHPLPVFGWRGNFISFYRDAIAFAHRVYQAHGPLALWMRDPTIVFALGPEFNRQVLSDTELFYANVLDRLLCPKNSAAEHLRAGLLRMNGAQHKQHRRLMMPAFHKQQVAHYCDGMAAITARFLDRWQVGRQADIAHAMRRLTMQIAFTTLFGLGSTAEDNHLAELTYRLLQAGLSPAVALFPFDLPGTPYRRALRLAEQVAAAFQLLLNRKRAAGAEQRDVLALLTQARDEDGVALTDTELIGHAATLFIAGHETTANTLAWTLFLLAQHPPVLGDLCDELDAVLGGAAPTAEQLGRLPLLERVIKESMRLLPPAAFAWRTSTAPFELGPYSMMAGTTVIISQYVTHHMAELYPEPQRFLPERWQTIDPSPYDYLPFSAGARRCIGATFAMAELKIVLALLLQRYRLNLVPGARIDRAVSFTLAPKVMPMIVAPAGHKIERVPVCGNIHEMVNLL